MRITIIDTIIHHIHHILIIHTNDAYIFYDIYICREDSNTIYYPWLCGKATQLRTDFYPILINLPNKIQTEIAPWCVGKAVEAHTFLSAKSNEIRVEYVPWVLDTASYMWVQTTLAAESNVGPLYVELLKQIEICKVVVETYTGPLTAPSSTDTSSTDPTEIPLFDSTAAYATCDAGADGEACQSYPNTPDSEPEAQTEHGSTDEL
jgi:hypothetical protein